MPTTLHLCTFHGLYRDAYSHLNQRQFVGTAKAPAPLLTHADGWSSSYKQTVRLDRATARLPLSVIRSALRSWYVRECRCEHDCCGHYNGGLYRLRKHGRNVTVWFSYHANV